MDAQQLRKALYDFFKFNPKDFIVKGSGTGYLVELARSLVGREEEQYLPPWSCYITDNKPNYVTLKVNPVSTLMETYGLHDDFALATWKDAYLPIDHFDDSFLLTSPTDVVWLEVEHTAGKITRAEVKSGAPWNSNLYYVDSDNRVDQGGTFTWYQLLAFFKLSSDPGGSRKDVVFSGSYYQLMQPTTTHLMQSVIRAVDDTTGSIDVFDFFAIVPWYQCRREGS